MTATLRRLEPSDLHKYAVEEEKMHGNCAKITSLDVLSLANNLKEVTILLLDIT